MKMIVELLNHRDPLRILLTLYQRGGLRFGRIQSLLNLNPAQVDRALKFLCKGRWIKGHPLPGQARRQTEYRIGKRGAALAEAFTLFAAGIREKKNEFGPAEIAAFQRFCQPALSAGRKMYTGKSGLVATIGSFPPDEAEESAEYRAGCLMLSPKERIDRMRALSRRLILLNPDNPRSPHIDFRHIRIIHDAI
jgi:DNA-binding MarR family transcriptional regulator